MIARRTKVTNQQSAVAQLMLEAPEAMLRGLTAIGSCD